MIKRLFKVFEGNILITVSKKHFAMKPWWKHILVIVFGLLVYLTIIAINDVYSPKWNRWERGWLVNIVEIVMSIGLSYGCVIIADGWERRQRIRRKDFRFGSLVSEFLLVFLSVFLFINVIGGPIMEVIDNYDLHDFIVINVIAGLFTLTYYFVIRGNFYIKEYIASRIKLEKLENDKVKEELKYLKNQIHPHFLFNALNTIYFQMEESVEQAKKSVEMFSDLLRYRLYDNQGEKTTLQKELDFVKNYIAFEKLRHTDRLKIDLSIPDVPPDIEIYPFLINPGIENAFKYVGGEMKINIGIKIKKEQLLLRVENSTDSDQVRARDESRGIGLNNLRRRLELLYPGKFVLINRELPGWYECELTLNLDAN